MQSALDVNSIISLIQVDLYTDPFIFVLYVKKSPKTLLLCQTTNALPSLTLSYIALMMNMIQSVTIFGMPKLNAESI